ERMKMRKSHIVPLSRQAIIVLQELRQLFGQRDDGYIFPSTVHWNKPVSHMTILNALERLGYKGRMTGHGFRSLAMSAIKEKLDYRHEVVDRQLAHGHRNKIDKAYDRTQFMAERIKMMQDWGDYISGFSHSVFRMKQRNITYGFGLETVNPSIVNIVSSCASYQMRFTA